MAKKATETKKGQLPDPVSMFKKIDDSVEVMEESVFSKINEYIPTGNYMLNACLTGSMFKGIPSGRTISLAGPNSSGKTFLALNIAANAQKMGYWILWLDSEGAVDNTTMTKIGIDTKKVLVKQVNTITETSQVISNLLNELENQMKEYGEHNKFMVVLDSMANLTSVKEKSAAADGSTTKDMTKQQELKALFRVNMINFAKLNVPFIVTNHVYASMNMYGPQTAHSGGSGLAYNASIVLELSPTKLVDKESEDAAAKQAGNENILKSGVMVKIKPVKNRYCISRYVKFPIYYFKKMSTLLGIEEYLDWEKAGIMRGVMLSQGDWDKLSDAEKESDKYQSFEHDGKTLYCQRKDTARSIVVRHLGGVVPITEFFSPKVFTDEYLHYLDDTIIRPAFELPDQASFNDVEEIEDLIDIGGDNQED